MNGSFLKNCYPVVINLNNSAHMCACAGLQVNFKRKQRKTGWCEPEEESLANQKQEVNNQCSTRLNQMCSESKGDTIHCQSFIDKVLSGAYWLIHNSFIEKIDPISVKEKIQTRMVGVFLCQGAMLRGSETAAWPLTPERTANRAGRGTRGGAAYGRPTCLPTSTSVCTSPTLMMIWLLQLSGKSIVLCTWVCRIYWVCQCASEGARKPESDMLWQQGESASFQPPHLHTSWLWAEPQPRCRLAHSSG